MNREVARPTRPSLLTRISETKAQASTTVDRAALEKPRQESFVDRYRGTEFDSTTPVMVAREDPTSRGRTYVIVGGTAALSIVGMLLVAAAS